MKDKLKDILDEIERFSLTEAFKPRLIDILDSMDDNILYQDDKTEEEKAKWEADNFKITYWCENCQMEWGAMYAWDLKEEPIECPLCEIKAVIQHTAATLKYNLGIIRI